MEVKVMNINKQIKKFNHQEKVNPGHKVAYQQPLRPRSTVFRSKKDYNKQQDQINIKKGNCDWCVY